MWTLKNVAISAGISLGTILVSVAAKSGAFAIAKKVKGTKKAS